MSFLNTDFRNGLWSPAANALGRIDVLADTIGLALIDITLHTADPDADTVLDDLAGAAIVGTETASGLTVIDGGVTFDPVVFAALVGAEWAGAYLFMDSGSAATSPLIAFCDDFDSPPDPPDGTDYTFNPSAAGFARITNP